MMTKNTTVSCNTTAMDICCVNMGKVKRRCVYCDVGWNDGKRVEYMYVCKLTINVIESGG